jgi:ankyrin repeat protein
MNQYQLNRGLFEKAKDGNLRACHDYISKGAELINGLCGAAEGDNIEAFELMVEKGAVNFYSAFNSALSQDSINIIKHMIKNKLLNNEQCIADSAQENKKEIFKLFQKKVTNLTMALCRASMKGNLEIVNEILKSKDCTFNLNQALNFAAQNGHLDVVKALVKAGAKEKSVAYDMAVKNGHDKVAKHLKPKK